MESICRALNACDTNYASHLLDTQNIQPSDLCAKTLLTIAAYNGDVFVGEWVMYHFGKYLSDKDMIHCLQIATLNNKSDVVAWLETLI